MDIKRKTISYIIIGIIYMPNITPVAVAVVRTEQTYTKSLYNLCRIDCTVCRINGFYVGYRSSVTYTATVEGVRPR